MTKFDFEIDTKGLKCPEPLMLVRNKVREMADGDVLRVIATDPSTHRDFTNFCRFLDHQLLLATEDDGTYEYLIRK